VDPGQIVFREGPDHQVALELAHRGLAEVIPEQVGAAAAFDGPIGMFVEHEPRRGVAVGPVDEPGVELDLAAAALLGHVAQRVVAGLHSLEHGAQRGVERGLAAPVPGQKIGGIEVGPLEHVESPVGFGAGLDEVGMHPDPAELRIRRRADARQQHGPDHSGEKTPRSRLYAIRCSHW
jgi:hypothetical protein